MTYYDGTVIPVKTADKARFIDSAERMDQFFLEHGAVRVRECWGADVPDGKLTDFNRAVQRSGDESVVFSWIEWPDKAVRDAAWKAMEDDERMKAEPMVFDGKRMIFGGFEPIVEQGEGGGNDYVQGFIIPVPEGKREAYRQMAEEAWEMFAGYGALSVVEAWGDDVPAGKQTDFYRAANAEPGENIVFSWMTWPSWSVCDEAAQKMQDDDSMKMPDDMPFDPRRMVWGGFEPIIDLEKQG